MILSRFLLLVSALMLLSGAYFPVAILMDTSPSVQVYGLVLFSFPMWALGAICAAIAAWRIAGKPSSDWRMAGLPWTLIALNLSMIVVCLFWSPEGVS